MPETTSKPGVQTTEFWLTIVTALTALVGSLKGVIPEQTAAIIGAVLTSIYTVARTVAKKG